MLDNEYWLPVPGYEDCYEVSDQGNVRSLDREIEAVNQFGPYIVFRRGTHRRLDISSRGHTSISLGRDGELIKFSVSRLVLTAFAYDMPKDWFAVHANGDQRDCSFTNLFWGRLSDTLYQTSGGSARVARAGNKARRKLTADQAMMCLKSRGAMNTMELAEIFGVTNALIGSIRRGRTYLDVTDHQP